jgi:hypothetical protein
MAAVEQDVRRARRGLARWLRRTAARVDTEPLTTIQVSVIGTDGRPATQTFIDCVPYGPRVIVAPDGQHTGQGALRRRRRQLPV